MIVHIILYFLFFVLFKLIFFSFYSIANKFHQVARIKHHVWQALFLSVIFDLLSNDYQKCYLCFVCLNRLSKLDNYIYKYTYYTYFHDTVINQCESCSTKTILFNSLFNVFFYSFLLLVFGFLYAVLLLVLSSNC